MQNSHQYLTDLEVQAIERFNADPVLADAVRKVLLSTVYEAGVIKKGKKLTDYAISDMNAALVLASKACSGNNIISDEALGQDLRGLWRGVQLVNTGFKELAKIKVKKEEGKGEKNPAI